MEFIIILIFYAYIIFKDLIPMFKNKSKKEAIIYSVMVTISLTVLILKVFNVDIPGPTGFIKNIVKSLK